MEFFKILWNNLVRGPVTEAFPYGEARTPRRFRGSVVVDPELCVGCGICRHVCTAGAINITARPDNSGYDIVVWHNSCCLCGQCRHYCPTGAVMLSNDWHTVHRVEKTYTAVEHQFVPYEKCEQCGALQRFLPRSLTEKLYDGMPELEGLPEFERLCVKCRMVATAVAEERACRLLSPEEQAVEANAEAAVSTKAENTPDKPLEKPGEKAHELGEKEPSHA